MLTNRFILAYTLLAITSTTGSSLSLAQGSATIHFDTQTRVFRIDAANQTYAFGINDKEALQPIYWGQRLSTTDPLTPPHTNARCLNYSTFGRT